MKKKKWKCELLVQIKPWVFNSVQIDMKKLLQCEDMSSLSVKKSISKIVVATYTIVCEKTNCE
jgi:hypothetical protein